MNLLIHPNTSKLLVFMIASSTLQFSLTSHAQTQPDAGQILRELQQAPAPDTAPIEPKLDVEPAPVYPQKSGDMRFVVKAVKISGNSAIPTAELQALVADLVGTERNLSELNAAAMRITAYYRAHGLMVAQAYIPAQEIHGGVVAIHIVEGRIANRRLDNQSRLSQERAMRFLDRIPQGAVIQSAQIDRPLLLLNDTPGVAGARASLQPGAEPGTSDLLVELKPSAPYSAKINLDNYGNRYTGEYQLGGAWSMNSPLQIGDQITLSGLVSEQDLTYWQANYQLPIGGDGWRMGVGYTEIRYHLGKEFEALQEQGSAATTSGFVAYPLIRSQQRNLTSMLMLEQSALSDSASDRKINVTNLVIAGDQQDAWGRGGISSFDLSLKLGQLNIETTLAREIDELSAKTNGSYSRLKYGINRLQRLSPPNQFLFKLSGQVAGNNLDSAEKFSLGGSKGVRAYPQGEGVGDQGYLINLEVAHDFADTLQGTMFYDIGAIKINRDPYSSEKNSRKLSGAGIGFNAQVASTQFKAALAWRMGSEEPASIPSSAVTPAILWVQASKSF